MTMAFLELLIVALAIYGAVSLTHDIRSTLQARRRRRSLYSHDRRRHIRKPLA